jgi:signal transduction histidine kinase
MPSPHLNLKDIFKLNIRKKFIIINFFIVIVLSVITSSYFFNFEKKNLYKKIVSEVTLFGETLAIPIVNDLIYEKLGLVEEGGLLDNYIREIFTEKKLNFLFITVLDDTDRVISHSDIAQYGKVFDDELMKKVNTEKKTVVSLSNDFIFSKNAEVLVPLFIGEKKWGTLRFAVSLNNERNEFFYAIFKIFLITVILIILGYLLVLYLSNLFVNPIINLANAMSKTDMEKLDTYIPVKGTDEFAYLTTQFNKMIERIRSANEELKKKNQMLLQSEKLASIGILASGIAHEINNPLGGIFNCIHMLANDKACSNTKYIELIKDGLERIENTVKKLLWIARKGEEQKEMVQLYILIEHVLEFVGYNISKKRIKIIKEVDEGLTVFINRADLEQVLLNLIINAIQAIEKEGEILICCRDEGDRIFFEISDNGSGIEEENINKIFDPFFTTKKQGEGTGLGLWITYEIIKNMGGEIWVESKKGIGTSFYFTIKKELEG